MPPWMQIIQETVDAAAKQPEPVTAARTVARSARIVGEMLEEMAETTTILKQPSAVVYWAGNLAWGIVEVAVPGSFWRILFRHWTRLFFALGVFLTLVGFIPWATGVQSFGVALLVITCVLESLALSLNYWMRAKPWTRPLLGLIALLGAAGTAYFALELRKSGAPAHHLALILCAAACLVAWAGIAAAFLTPKPMALWGALALLVAAAAALEIARNIFWYIGYYQVHPELLTSGPIVWTEVVLVTIVIAVSSAATLLVLLLRAVRAANQRVRPSATQAGPQAAVAPPPPAPPPTANAMSASAGG